MNAGLTTFVVVVLLISASISGQAEPGAPLTTSDTQALYWKGHEALGIGDWDLALTHFSEVERRLRPSEPVDAAIYWQAYAQARAGRMDNAVRDVRRLRSQYPKSPWYRDAALLITRVAATNDSAAQIAAELTNVDDARAEFALESLLSLQPAQAIPKLVSLLQGSQSLQFKKRVLFVLSQMDDAGANAQIALAAQGNDAELTAAAVRMLGAAGATEELKNVYATVAHGTTKRLILKSLGTAAYRDAVAEDFLASVARAGTDIDLRIAALEALGSAGSVDSLSDVAGSNASVTIRREAIRALGVAGGSQRLLALYPRVLDLPELRDEVLRSLLMASGDRPLIELYQKAGTAVEKQAVLRILQQSGSPLDR